MRSLPAAAALLALLAGSALLSGCTLAKLTSELNSPLARAVKSENRAAIFAALAKDVQVKSANPQGRELVLAVLENRKADALGLVENGADLNATIINTLWGMYDGYTPLALAAWADDLDIAKAIIAKGADVNATIPYGSVIFVAQTAPMVKLLLDGGAPINQSMKGGATPLSSFALQGNSEVTRLLISRGADTDKARDNLEERLRSLQSSEYASDARWVKMIAETNAGIKLIERIAPAPSSSQAAAQTVSGGVTKAELAQMMKEAAAETARQAPAAAPVAPAAVVYKSDVDQPSYKVAPNPDAYALVIGVEKYNTLPDARFAERDARAMNAHLLAMGYPQRNIVLLTGAQATRTGLAKNLEAWLPNNVTERSTVMFYFSGHGAPDAKTSQAYLVPMDGDPQYLEETAYPIKRLYAKLAALKAKRVLVALDSCFSGAGGRSVLAQGTRPLVAKMELAPAETKVVSLSASSSEEITGALEEQGHGLFTYHLLKALTETAGRGTVDEVYSALKPRVQDEARRQNRAQTPQVFGQALDGGLR